MMINAAIAGIRQIAEKMHDKKKHRDTGVSKKT